MARVVVANSSVLIHLSRINLLNLLKDLFGKIYIPEAVYHEVVTEGRGKSGADVVERANWIKTEPVRNRVLVNYLSTELDHGESEAIVLAMELKADLILLDESEARKIARSLGLNTKGTIGVLLLAWRKGLLDDIEKVINELVSKGFWLKETIRTKLLQEIKKAQKRLRK